MQNVVTVSATAGNLRVQRFSRYFSAPKSPFRLRATLAQPKRKLATIYGAALLSACAFCATAVDVHAQVVLAQVNAQVDSQNSTIKREIKVPPGRDVRVAIYTSIRSDCSWGPLPSIRLAVAPAHGTVTVKRATLKATNLKQCLAAEAPAFVAFYRAAHDFRGRRSVRTGRSLFWRPRRRSRFPDRHLVWAVRRTANLNRDFG
jgi:hypothetical protein